MEHDLLHLINQSETLWIRLKYDHWVVTGLENWRVNIVPTKKKLALRLTKTSGFHEPGDCNKGNRDSSETHCQFGSLGVHRYCSCHDPTRRKFLMKIRISNRVVFRWTITSLRPDRDFRRWSLFTSRRTNATVVRVDTRKTRRTWNEPAWSIFYTYVKNLVLRFICEYIFSFIKYN